jgi:hypothetical protein
VGESSLVEKNPAENVLENISTHADRPMSKQTILVRLNVILNGIEDNIFPTQNELFLLSS